MKFGHAGGVAAIVLATLAFMQPASAGDYGRRFNNGGNVSNSQALSASEANASLRSSNRLSASTGPSSANASNGGNNNYFAGSNIPNNTPDVIPPALNAGANPCVQSTSIGGGGSGFGISFGSTYRDSPCNVRNWYLILYNQYEQNPRDQALAYSLRYMVCSDPDLQALKLPMCQPDTAQPAPAPVAMVQPVPTMEPVADDYRQPVHHAPQVPAARGSNETPLSQKPLLTAKGFLYCQATRSYYTEQDQSCPDNGWLVSVNGTWQPENG